ncbi:MAG: ligand-binding sensor domain-containing protein, partial [Flavobacterium sp.]
MKNLKYIFVCYCIFINYVFPQGKFDNYQFRNIQETSSKRAISSIVQDNNGFFWIGTIGSGLFRYDGVNYVGYRYDQKKTGSLNSDVIFTTFVDSYNNLWVGTDEGLCLYNRDLDNFTKITIEDRITNGFHEPVTIKTIAQDNSGNLILGTYGFGLFKLNIKTQKATPVRSKLFQKPNFLIKCFAKNRQGTIYLGTSYGLLEMEPNGNINQVYINKFKTKAVSDDIESMVVDKFGYIWLGTFSNGLTKIKPETDNYEYENYAVTKNKILSVIQSRHDYIICGTENDGLLIIDFKGHIVKKYLHNKYDDFSLKSNSVWSLYEDKEKRLWLGYYNKGLGIFDKPNSKFTAIESLVNNDNSLQTSYVTSVVKDKEDRLLISTEGGGLDIYNLRDKNFIHVNDKNQGYYSGLDA